MIAFLSGKIEFKGEDFIILDVNGVGYKVFLIFEILKKIKLKQKKKFFVHYHLRENDVSLFGFSKYEELNLFEKIISVSGIGPKMGLGIMSAGSIKQVQSAIASKNLDFLTSVSGVGKRMAEKICFGLKGKIDEVNMIKLEGKQELIDSLVGLGYKKFEATEVAGKIDGGMLLSLQIKEALKYLGR